MNDNCFYRVSVKGIVIDEQGRVLLAREANGHWEMMGGGLEHGEDPKTCLSREIQEETGLTVASISESPKYFVTALRPGTDTFTANIIYQIELKDMNFTPTDECEELRFFTVDEMEELDMYPNVRQLYDILSQQVPPLA